MEVNGGLAGQRKRGGQQPEPLQPMRRFVAITASEPTLPGLSGPSGTLNAWRAAAGCLPS
ncbi:MAG: hypothetical protein ACRDYX_03430 [Egibacteraceae bacterium]